MKHIVLLILITFSLQAAQAPVQPQEGPLQTFGQMIEGARAQDTAQEPKVTGYATIREYLSSLEKKAADKKEDSDRKELLTRQIKPANTVVTLSGTQIMSLDGLQDIPGIENVEHLNLSGNKFNRLNNEINALENLQELDLSDNKFSNITFEPSTRLKKLQKLYLYNNKITLTPNMFVGLPHLKVLGLSGNQIATIPAGTFNGLSNLTTLQLDNNKLFELKPGVFNGLTHVKIINLRGNKATGANQWLLTIDPNVFEGLENLQEVHLQDVPLTDANKEQLKNKFPNVRFNF